MAMFFVAWAVFGAGVLFAVMTDIMDGRREVGPVPFCIALIFASILVSATLVAKP